MTDNARQTVITTTKYQTRDTVFSFIVAGPLNMTLNNKKPCRMFADELKTQIKSKQCRIASKLKLPGFPGVEGENIGIDCKNSLYFRKMNVLSSI